MTDWRSLVSRMADELDHYRQLVTDDRREVHSLAKEARAVLSQPEPEVVVPSDEELLELWQGWNLGWDPQKGTVLMPHPAEYARAVLARFGCPAPAPAEGDPPVDLIIAAYRSGVNDARVTTEQIMAEAERQAAPVPVALSQRPWEREGWCHPEERWAWFYNRRVGWRDAIPPESLKPPTLFPYTHSLPFNALPLPSGEVEA